MVPCALDGIRHTSRPTFPARLVVGPDGEESGQLALAPGVGLHGHLGVAGGLSQPCLQVVDQFEVAGSSRRGRQGMDVGEAPQPDRFHLGRRVELHGARTERDHAAVEREVAIRQTAQVAQHRRLGAVLREDGVHEDRPLSQQGLGQGVGRASGRASAIDGVLSSGSAPNAPSTAATWAGVVVSPHVIPTRSSSTSRSKMPRPSASATTAAARPGVRATTVSKYSRCARATPARSSPAPTAAARAWTRRAMARRPSGPW